MQTQLYPDDFASFSGTARCALGKTYAYLSLRPSHGPRTPLYPIVIEEARGYAPDFGM